MEQNKGEGIKKIAVKGFKSIAEECSIDIYPLTILAGANSSGKSSIMQPFLMLKQTLEAPYDPGPLLIDGPNVQFTYADQFLSATGEKKNSCFQISIEATDLFGGSGHLLTTTLTFKKGESGIEIAEMVLGGKFLPYQQLPDTPPWHFILYPKMPLEEIRAQSNEYRTLKDVTGVERLRCFLDFTSKNNERTLYVTEEIEDHILHSIHIPGLRGNPERTYKLSNTGPRYPGTFENYVASLIHQWQETQDDRLKTLTEALQILGLTGQIGTDKINDTRIELRVGSLPHDGIREASLVSIADVGFGVSQVLPVLVALIAASPSQLVYLEQPELHLHPRAQVALAQVLADAAKRGVSIVAETHSSLLLLGVQTLVAEGKLAPDLVKLHWFSRNGDGITQVDAVNLDEAGTYGEWPVDFDDVSLNLKSRFLDAVDDVRFGNMENS